MLLAAEGTREDKLHRRWMALGFQVQDNDFAQSQPDWVEGVKERQRWILLILRLTQKLCAPGPPWNCEGGYKNRRKVKIEKR